MAQEQNLPRDLVGITDPDEEDGWVTFYKIPNPRDKSQMLAVQKRDGDTRTIISSWKQ